jgi:DNA-binding MarR family transcriptional regulator
VTVNVTDSQGARVSPTAYITIAGGPTVTKPLASRPAIDAGQGVDFSVTVTSNFSVTYAWIVNHRPAALIGCSNTANPSMLLCPDIAAPGTYAISVNVTDSGGFTTPSRTLSYTVYADPSPVLKGPAKVDAGISAIYAVTITGGYGYYSYSWNSSGVMSCPHVNYTQAACQGTGFGTGNVIVTVTDQNGVTNSTALTVTADPPLVVTATLASGSTTVPLNQSTLAGGYLLVVNAGSSLWVNGTVSGGTPPYVLTVSMNGSVVDTHSNVSAISTSVSLPYVGVDTLSFNVTDGAATEMIQGAVQVQGIPMNVTLNAPLVANVSQSVNLTATVSGGAGPFTYYWTAQSGTFSSGQSATNTTTPTSSVKWGKTGQYNVSVTVTDTQRLRAYSRSTVVVGYAPLTVKWTATSPLDANSTIENVTVTVHGGIAPYKYEWYEEHSPVRGNTWNTTVPYSYLSWFAMGTFNASVTVTDAHGAIGRISGVFVVESPLTLSCWNPVVSGSLTVGSPVTFSLPCTPHGGMPPYTYNWNLASGGSVTASPFTNGTGITFSHTFTAAGLYQVWMYANDSAHGATGPTNRITFHITASSSGNNVLSQFVSSPWFYYLFLPILVVVIVLLSFFLINRRRAKRAKASKPAAIQEGGAASLSPLQWAILDHLDQHPLEEQQRLAMAVSSTQEATPDAVLSAVGFLGPMGLLDSRMNMEDKETRYELTESGKKTLTKHREAMPSQEPLDTKGEPSGSIPAVATAEEDSSPPTPSEIGATGTPSEQAAKEEPQAAGEVTKIDIGAHKQLGEKRLPTEEANPYKGRVKPEDVNPQQAGMAPIPAELLQPLELQHVQDRGEVERTPPGKSDIDYDAKVRELEEKKKGIKDSEAAKEPAKQPRKRHLADWMKKKQE